MQRTIGIGYYAWIIAFGTPKVVRTSLFDLTGRIDSAKESFLPIMSKKMASIILAYGIALAALGLFIQQTPSTFARVVFVTGIAGGGLCVLWGIAGFAGYKRRTGAVLTLIALTLVLLSQAVKAWLPSDAASLTGQLVPTLMFLATIGMLLYVLHGERPPEFYNPGAVGRENTTSRGERAQ
jgi:hypothetical protein